MEIYKMGCDFFETNRKYLKVPEDFLFDIKTYDHCLRAFTYEEGCYLLTIRNITLKWGTGCCWSLICFNSLNKSYYILMDGISLNTSTILKVEVVPVAKSISLWLLFLCCLGKGAIVDGFLPITFFFGAPLLCCSFFCFFQRSEQAAFEAATASYFFDEAAMSRKCLCVHYTSETRYLFGCLDYFDLKLKISAEMSLYLVLNVVFLCFIVDEFYTLKIVQKLNLNYLENKISSWPILYYRTH